MVSGGGREEWQGGGYGEGRKGQARFMAVLKTVILEKNNYDFYIVYLS